MKPPLIALTAPELAGGIGRNTVNLANEFDSMGYRVDVVVDTRKGQLIDQLRNNVGVKLLRTSHTVGGLYSLTSYLLKARPRVILTPVVRHTILALRARSLALSSASVFVQVHNTYSKTFSLLKPAKRSTRIKHIEKYYPRCNGIITVSKGVADDFSALSGIPGSSLDTIYNPIVTPDLEASAAEEVDHINLLSLED